MTMKFKCSICGRKTKGLGCNPWPVRPSVDDRCCAACDKREVFPARMRAYLILKQEDEPAER
jgi:hypothetical protein